MIGTVQEEVRSSSNDCDVIYELAVATPADELPLAPAARRADARLAGGILDIAENGEAFVQRGLEYLADLRSMIDSAIEAVRTEEDAAEVTEPTDFDLEFADDIFDEQQRFFYAEVKRLIMVREALDNVDPDAFEIRLRRGWLEIHGH